MRVGTFFRPILIFLLLCYGKKFIDANDIGVRLPYSSHEPPDPPLTETFYLNTHSSHNESFNLSQSLTHLEDSRAHYSNSYDYYPNERHNQIHVSKIEKRPKFDHNHNYYSSDENKSQDQLFKDLDRNGRRIPGHSEAYNHEKSYRRHESSSYNYKSCNSQGNLTHLKKNSYPRESNNLLIVDIGERRSSSLIRFERNDAGDYDIFTPLEPYLIAKLIKGERELWSSKDGVYADRVFVKYLDNGLFKLRMFYAHQGKGKSVDQGPSSGNTIDPNLQKHYRLISIDVNNTFSTDEVFYRIECDGTKSLFSRPGFLFDKVFKGDLLLWQYNDIDASYVNRIYMGLNDSGREIVNVRFPGDEILVSLDVDVKKSTDKFVYYRRPDGTEVFSCRPGYLFAKISMGNRFLWKCQDGVYSDNALVFYNDYGERVLRLFYPQYEQKCLKPTPESGSKPSQPPKHILDKFPELIDFDIRKRSLGDKIVCKVDENGTRSFTCNPGYLLRKVSKSSKILWESDGSSFADKFYIYIGSDGKPFLRVSFYPLEMLPEELRVPKPTKPEAESVRKEDDVKTVLKKKDSGDVKRPETVDGSKFRPRVVSIDDLRLFIVDPSLKKGQDKFEYEKAEFDNVDLTVPKDSYSVFKPKPVIKPTLSPKHDSLPSKVLLLFDEGEKEKAPIEPKPKVEPEKPKVDDKKEEPKPETPRVEKKEEVKPEPEKAPDQESIGSEQPEEPERKLVPISLDLSRRRTSEELGYLPSDKTATFIAKGDSVINNVTIENYTIWSETDPLKFSTKVGMDGIGLFKKPKNVSIYQTNGKILHYLKSSSGEWRNISNQWTLDVTKKAITYIFNYDECYGEGTYTPKEDFIFKGLEDRSLTSRILSCFNKKYGHIWVSDSAPENTKKAIIDGISFGSYIKNISVYMENGEFKHFHRKSKFLPWNQISNHIELNVNIKKSTHRFFYKVYDLGTYTTNHDFVFSVIRHDSFYLNRKGIDVIWKTDSKNDSDCANKVVIDGTGANSVPLNVAIFLVNGTIKHFSRKTFFSEWKEVSNKVELDINIIDSSMQIDVTLDKRFKYFSANHNFEIITIRDKKNVIWQAEKDEICKKVIYKGVKSQLKELTLFLPQGPKVFKKKSKNDVWADVSVKLTSDSTVTDSKDNDNSHKLAKLKDDLVNSFSHSKISIQTEGSSKTNDVSQYETTSDEDNVIFEMKNESKCIGVKYGKKLLWEYDKGVHGNLYPKKVHFLKKKLLVIVDFNVISFLYRYGPNDQMDLVYTKRPVPVEIDLDDYESMIEVKFEITSSHAIFEAKEHYAINPLKYGDTKIFDSDNNFSVIVKVKVEPPKSPKKICVELLNGTKKLFQGSDKSWQEAPVESC